MLGAHLEQRQTLLAKQPIKSDKKSAHGPFFGKNGNTLSVEPFLMKLRNFLVVILTQFAFSPVNCSLAADLLNLFILISMFNSHLLVVCRGRLALVVALFLNTSGDESSP